MMNLIANITQTVAALVCMIVLLGGDITAHHSNGHSNGKYYRWLSKSGELLSSKRLLLLAVFIGTFTTMAQQSWMVVMLLAATLLVTSAVLMGARNWKLMEWNRSTALTLATAMIIAMVAIGAVAYAGNRTSTVFSSRVSAMFAVMLLPVTPLLTMLAAWMLSPLIEKTKNANQGDKNKPKE